MASRPPHRRSSFPRLKRLADFSTDSVPAITPTLHAHLATGAYLDKGEPVVLLGDSGTGKTHLLIGLAWPPASRVGGSATS